MLKTPEILSYNPKDKVIGKPRRVRLTPLNEQKIQGGIVSSTAKAAGMQTGDMFLVTPVPDPDDPTNKGFPVTNYQRVFDDKSNENTNNNSSPGKVIDMNNAAKVGAGLGAAAIVGYLLWKGVEFAGTIPVCGGCGVLSPL